MGMPLVKKPSIGRSINLARTVMINKSKNLQNYGNTSKLGNVAGIHYY